MRAPGFYKFCNSREDSIIKYLKYQHTVKQRVEFKGVGLHSGKIVHLNIYPSEVNTGIQFHRIDTEGAEVIQANPDNICSTELCTSIGNGKKQDTISTIEHFMAALYHMNIDNAYITINAPELPIMDGSCAPFLDILMQTGIKRQKSLRQYYRVKSQFQFEFEDKWIQVEPSACFEIDSTIDFSRTQAIGRQKYHLVYNPEDFINEIGQARTFCHINDVNKMRDMGLALGGSLDNAVVVDDEKVLNAEGLRHENEFVRHKILDTLGDLYLLGKPLIGKVAAYKSGHSLHGMFMKELLKVKDEVLEVVVVSEKDEIIVERELNQEGAKGIEPLPAFIPYRISSL